jgi:hypothetical protein
MKMKPIWYKNLDPKTKAAIERQIAENRRRVPNAWPGTIDAIMLQIAAWGFGLWILYKIFHWLFG